VNYCVRGQDATGLRIGSVEFHHTPRLDHDVEALLELGVPVHFVREDAEECGIPEGKLVDGVKSVSRRDIPAMLDQYDQAWHW
jgi:hypothetical protein